MLPEDLAAAGWPADFATRGWHVHRDGPLPPKSFQVMGERSSGTNLAALLFEENTPLVPRDVLGWKHGFVQAGAIPRDLVVICMLRDARDWARSMHAKPWHATEEVQARDFASFLRSPWDSRLDRKRYFEVEGQPGYLGQALQQDRDPVTGARFANLFALRRAKLRALLGYLNRDCTCVFLRTEVLQRAPQATVAAISAALGLAAAGPEAFVTTERRLGARFRAKVKDRPRPPPALSAADLAFLRQELDLELEAALGFDYAAPAPDHD